MPFENMAPLLIEGNTLGQKYKNYNKLVKETKQEQIADIDYEEPDLSNLLKIDIAIKNRNVNYILKVFQCDDMLYVSRAIKRSTWLVTEPQYAHVINPTYLYNELSPNMTARGFNKLILHIRIHLKDEKRVEEFFNYYIERDLKVAFKWLPNCSIQLIENIIQKHADDIPRRLLVRLCERSITCLYKYMHGVTSYYKRDTLASTMFLLKNNMEKYLDIVEACESYDVPRFGHKSTKLIMKRCNERVMKNLDKYAAYVHIPTFAKFIKPEDIKDFIMKNVKNEKMRSWFSYNKIKPFVQRLPVESRFEFVKEIFIDKKQEDLEDDIVAYCGENFKCKDSSSQHIYRWYTYAPFNTAFADLKKVIRTESNPTERTAMYGVMLTCAGKDMKNIHSLLKYYRENHINEPFKFKIQFVNLVISYTNTHNFDKETWGYLNDLFSSMEVYSESDKLVQNCVRSIILYRVTHDESVPDIIEKKFLFDTFKSHQEKLMGEQKEKVFLYLYNYLQSNIDNCKIKNKKELTKAVELLTNILNLLVDWKKELKEFPTILNKIKEIIQINKTNKWDVDISVLYNVKKTWKKLLFAESIILSPSQEACINALKHGPELLESYKAEVESLCLNDNILVDQFLKKVRVFWSHSLANSYKELFVDKLDQKNTHKAVVIGLCILLPKNELSNLIQKHVPSDTKIDWTQPDDFELSLRKHIASNLHKARPQPSPAAILLYAKGDYLQFSLPSLNAIFHNMSSKHTREHLPELLNSPVSLQKHGIRVAFAKLKHDELKKLFSDIWKTNKNSSIRAAVFNQTLDFLCKEKDPTAIGEIWELLSLFIDNLTAEESKSIYTKLSKVERVPMSVRPEFWMKSYRFLKSLPPKDNCDSLLKYLRNKMSDVMEFLDNDLIAEIFLESFDENFSTKQYEFQFLVAVFLLSTKTEEAQIARYRKVFVPILERSLAMWNKTHEGVYNVKCNLKEILMNLDNQFEDLVGRKKMFLPTSIYTDIFERLRKNLSITENYVMITTRQLALDYVQLYDEQMKLAETFIPNEGDGDDQDDSAKIKSVNKAIAQKLGALCVKYLKEDVSNNFPSIYILFAEAFHNIFNNFNFNDTNKMIALKVFLDFKDFIPGHLFVLQSLPKYIYDDDEKALKSELLKDIQNHRSVEIKMHYWYKQ
ncbi:uncharacterized protein LOC126778700 [Nymphalis io]|uniref:uncharacterized protein LOC126778700 n=1 Tax=Inachis io TaxID=171585 RepID=UPI0021697EE4|nr:uncharacterized protein LOC126778700 [Nymphalis io]XP_050358275.1 uncharacterized protein LOC126778700 [Nymphalis io]